MTAALRETSTEAGFGRYELLPVADLHTDGSYQRELSAWRVRDIVLNYVPILFQPLIIGQRKGVYYVIDGQHRLAAAKEKGFTIVPCMVYETKSVAEEARAFVWLQQFRRRITTPQKFVARIAYKDPAAIEISELLKKHKFEIGSYEGFKNSSHRKNNVIVAVGAVEKAFDEGGSKRVDDLLYVLRNAWDGRAAALERGIILGLGRFMAENAYSKTALAEKLGAIAPYDLQLAAMSVGHQHGLAPSDALSRVIGNLYRDAPLRSRAGIKAG